MLAAVEQWVRRDHDAEWRQWTAWLEEIAQRVKTVDGIGLTTEITQPAGLSNRTPSLKISWDRTGAGDHRRDGRADAVSDRAPHLAVSGARRSRGSDRRVDHALHDGARRRRGDRRLDCMPCCRAGRQTRPSPPSPASPVADVTGTWDVRVAFAASQSTHTLHLRQRGNTIDGSHQGDFVSRELTGDHRRHARCPSSRSTAKSTATRLNYRFTGTIDGDTMTGSLDMGEYLKATWSAARRERSSRR